MYFILQRSIPKLKVWFGLRLVIILFKCIMYLNCLLLGLQTDPQMPHVVFTLVHLYGLWVVGDLISEIKREAVEGGPATILGINKHSNSD